MTRYKSNTDTLPAAITQKGAVRQTSPSRCCQTNEPKHQYLVDGYFYEVTNERHSVRAASRFSLNVLRVESDLCELNRL